MKSGALRAAFITQHSSWPWDRQLTMESVIHQGIEFSDSIENVDVIFIYDELPGIKLEIPNEVPVVFVCSEPPNVKRYRSKFLNQFEAIITADRDTEHPHPIYVQAGLPWHLGSMSDGEKYSEHPLSFEDLKNLSPSKKKLVSVVSSNKDFTQEHRDRLKFVSKLKDALGEQVDVFGRGLVDFVDKRDVLDQYRYHIAIENCRLEDYWTEKIADPFLSLTYPIYHGCPNLSDYFPEESFSQINIYEPEASIEKIKRIIASDIAEKNRAALLASKKLVLFEHNVFALLARVSKELIAQKQLFNKRCKHRIIFSENRFLPVEQKIKQTILTVIERFPLLLKVRQNVTRLRSVFEYKKAIWMRKLKHDWLYISDRFYRAHHNYISQNPQDECRYGYNLHEGALVLDVGGFDGDFAQACLSRFNASVTIFEPIETFAQRISSRFNGDKRITVHTAGLSDRDETAEFNLEGNATGLYSSSSVVTEKVILWDVERFIVEHQVSKWDLLKLNIEGGEYAVLKKLIDSGLIKRFKYIQVQFHLNIPDARKKYKEIKKQLCNTHDIEWCYPFVWESWKCRD